MIFLSPPPAISEGPPIVSNEPEAGQGLEALTLASSREHVGGPADPALSKQIQTFFDGIESNPALSPGEQLAFRDREAALRSAVLDLRDWITRAEETIGTELFECEGNGWFSRDCSEAHLISRTELLNTKGVDTHLADRALKTIEEIMRVPENENVSLLLRWEGDNYQIALVDCGNKPVAWARFNSKYWMSSSPDTFHDYYATPLQSLLTKRLEEFEIALPYELLMLTGNDGEQKRAGVADGLIGEASSKFDKAHTFAGDKDTNAAIARALHVEENAVLSSQMRCYYPRGGRSLGELAVPATIALEFTLRSKDSRGEFRVLIDTGDIRSGKAKNFEVLEIADAGFKPDTTFSVGPKHRTVLLAQSARNSGGLDLWPFDTKALLKLMSAEDPALRSTGSSE